MGSLLGSEGLKREGQEQNRAGQGQEAKGQLSDLGSGVRDRVEGKVGGAVAGLKGDAGEGERERRDAQHDVGKSLQRGVESELRE